MFPFLDRLVTLQRTTAYVLDEADAAATMSPDRQPSIASVVDVTVEGGTSNTGTVKVSGTDPDGVAQTDTLTFTGEATKDTAPNRYATLDDFTTTGLADEAIKPTVSAKAVGYDGSENSSRYELAAGRGAAVIKDRGSWQQPVPGSASMNRAVLVMGWESGFVPRKGDLAADDSTGEEWQVESVETVPDPYQPTHWEMDVVVIG